MQLSSGLCYGAPRRFRARRRASRGRPCRDRRVRRPARRRDRDRVGPCDRVCVHFRTWPRPASRDPRDLPLGAERSARADRGGYGDPGPYSARPCARDDPDERGGLRAHGRSNGRRERRAHDGGRRRDGGSVLRRLRADGPFPAAGVALQPRASGGGEVGAPDHAPKPE